MPSASVLIVDDSVVVRRMLSRMIDEFPGFNVAASVASGAAALEFVGRSHVDVITLDVEMEPMNGLEFLEDLKRRSIRVPVLMLSSLTSKGTEVTLEALLRGAADYIHKPNSLTATGGFADELQTKLRALCRIERRPSKPFADLPARMHQPSGRFSLVVIGASTGGPEALTKVLSGLPGDFALPILVVQHMPPQFTGPFAERLNDKCAVNVVHACHGMRAEAGTVYVAPGGRHLAGLATADGGLLLQQNDKPLLHGCRPAFDLLLESIFSYRPKQTLVALLTGMGADGASGALELRNRGATVLVQDKETSVVWGMPGSAVRLNAVDRVLPLNLIAPTIDQMCRPAVKRAGVV